MKLNNLLTLVIVALGMFSTCYSQSGYPINSITSELITGESIGKLPAKSKSIISGSSGVLDIDERFYYQLRNEYQENPASILPIGCFIKKIEYIVRYENEFYGPFYIEETAIPRSTDGCRFSSTPRALLKVVKTEVLDKLTSRNIKDLQIVIKGIWFPKSELTKPCAGINNITAEENRIDRFTLNIRKFGLLALVDVSPLSKSGGDKNLDIFSGLFQNISKTSIDYVALLNKSSFSNVMVSTPFLKYQHRDWFYRNFEIECVFVMDVNDNSKPIGLGLGFGALGEKDKTIKGGVFWVNNAPNYYIGLSLRGLAGWLSNYR